MDAPIRPLESLSVREITAMAIAAIERGEPLEKANPFTDQVGSAMFEGAYKAHAQPVAA